ncbi:unnamed protein product, partial [Thlaspi arvense]
MRPISNNGLIYRQSLRLRCNSTLALSNYEPYTPTTATRNFPETTSTTIFQCNSQISKLAKNGNLQEAEAIFRNMSQRSIVSWNAMLSAYAENGKMSKACQVFDEMPVRATTSYNAMITAMVKNKCDLGKAYELFRDIPEKNAVSYATMITGFVKAGMFEKADLLYAETPLKFRDPVASNVLLTCRDFVRYREGSQIHGLVSRMPLEFDMFLGNSLISMYSKLGYMAEAKAVFGVMTNKDSVSWNSLITGLVQSGQISEAYELFEKMPSKDMVSWTDMIKGFSGIGEVSKCVELFKMMPEKDGITWTAMISAFVSNGYYEEAICWFRKMLREEVCPNSYTFSSVLSATASLAALIEGLQIHTRVVKMNIENDLSVQNSLVSMYSKCGNTNDAYRIFSCINEPNIVSYNTMISGFSYNACGGFILAFALMSCCLGKEKETLPTNNPNIQRSRAGVTSTNGDFLFYPAAASLPTVSSSGYCGHHHGGGHHSGVGGGRAVPKVVGEGFFNSFVGTALGGGGCGGGGGHHGGGGGGCGGSGGGGGCGGGGGGGGGGGCN